MSYRKFIQKHMSKIEKVLKLVLPKQMLVEQLETRGWGRQQRTADCTALKGEDQRTAHRAETFGGIATIRSSSASSSGNRHAQIQTMETKQGDDLKARMRNAATEGGQWTISKEISKPHSRIIEQWTKDPICSSNYLIVARLLHITDTMNEREARKTEGNRRVRDEGTNIKRLR